MTTTKEILQRKLDGKDVNSLIEILEMWKENPQNLLDIFTSGILTFDYKKAKNGLLEFYNMFNKVSSILCDTEDGKHFHHLSCLIESYLNILNQQQKPDNILN